MIIRSAFAKSFLLAAVFSGAALSVASVGIEDEDGTVLAGDLDRLAGVGALVEEVETRLLIVVWNPFADGLPRRHDGLEGFDIEGWVGRREAGDAGQGRVEWRDGGRIGTPLRAMGRRMEEGVAS